MHLSEKDVRGIAEYVRIGLTDEEVVTMTEDLNNIIDTLQPITEYDLEGVEPTFHPIGDLSNVMREDAEDAGRALPIEAALLDAASPRDRYFRVPSILGEGSAS